VVYSTYRSFFIVKAIAKIVNIAMFYLVLYGTMFLMECYSIVADTFNMNIDNIV